MPVPPLKSTVEKLMESLQPVCSAEELKELDTLSKVIRQAIVIILAELIVN